MDIDDRNEAVEQFHFSKSAVHHLPSFSVPVSRPQAMKPLPTPNPNTSSARHPEPSRQNASKGDGLPTRRGPTLSTPTDPNSAPVGRNTFPTLTIGHLSNTNGHPRSSLPPVGPPDLHGPGSTAAMHMNTDVNGTSRMPGGFGSTRRQPIQRVVQPVQQPANDIADHPPYSVQQRPASLRVPGRHPDSDDPAHVTGIGAGASPNNTFVHPVSVQSVRRFNPSAATDTDFEQNPTTSARLAAIFRRHPTPETAETAQQIHRVLPQPLPSQGETPKHEFANVAAVVQQLKDLSVSNSELVSYTHC